MSKNLKKLSAEEKAIKLADAEQNRLDTRDHEFGDGTKPQADAPLGLQSSDPSSVTGPNAFTAIDELSSVGRIVGLRAIANSGICAAVFAALRFLTEEDTEKAEEARKAMVTQAELHSLAASELQTFALTKYDQPMTLQDAIQFASSNASDQRVNPELPEEFLKELGISVGQLALIDAEERRKQVARDTKLREQFRANADDIAAEVHGHIDLLHADYRVLDGLNIVQHQALMQKVAKKLGARVGQLLAIRAKYDGALTDALMVSGDVKTFDKQYTAFCKANRGELDEAREAA